jgi:uncharacterized protein (DUF2461 family)
VLIEGLAAGADKAKIRELSIKWQCYDDDAQEYANRVGARLSKDGSQWCATRTDFIDLQSSPAGFGDTALEAMAELCKELGYHPSKMWGASFRSLLGPSRAILRGEGPAE